MDETDLPQRLAAALAAAGYDTLDEQAKARKKMLNNPHLPPAVRAILQDN